MVTLSPVGLAATPVANQVSFLATFKEKLCKPFCIDSTVQPVVTINYSTGTARLVGTTVFVPITANISVVTQPGCCNAKTQLFTETFYAAFQGQTALPATITLTSVGRLVGSACVNCGHAKSIKIDDSLVVTISA